MEITQILIATQAVGLVALMYSLRKLMIAREEHDKIINDLEVEKEIKKYSPLLVRDLKYYYKKPFASNWSCHRCKSRSHTKYYRVDSISEWVNFKCQRCGFAEEHQTEEESLHKNN